jgi:hypothetical protein
MTKIMIDNGETVFELTCNRIDFTTSAPIETLRDAPCRFRIDGDLHAISPEPEAAKPPEASAQVINLTPAKN